MLWPIGHLAMFVAVLQSGLASLKIGLQTYRNQPAVTTRVPAMLATSRARAWKLGHWVHFVARSEILVCGTGVHDSKPWREQRAGSFKRVRKDENDG